MSKQERWRCGIEEYIPFPKAVRAKTSDGKYLEEIHRNQWAKVRRTKPDVFKKIIELSGISAPTAIIATSIPPIHIFPAIEQITPTLIAPGAALLKPKPTGKGAGTSGTLRRSRYCKAIGDRAEEIALKYLMHTLPIKLSEGLRWIASDGETPGWDIQYGPKGSFIAVEVKGTTGHQFAAIEMTAGEWRAASVLRNRFHLMLVSRCSSSSP